MRALRYVILDPSSVGIQETAKATLSSVDLMLCQALSERALLKPEKGP